MQIRKRIHAFWFLNLDNVQVIEFSTGEGKIRINKKNTKTYYNQTKYDLGLADNADVWHMVVVISFNFWNWKTCLAMHIY